jgi:hypothetical protein
VVLGGSEEVAEGKGELGGWRQGTSESAGRRPVRSAISNRPHRVSSSRTPGRCAGSQHMRDRAWLSRQASSRCGLRRAQLRSRYEITCPSIGISLRLLMPFPEFLRSSYSLTTAYPPVEAPQIGADAIAGLDPTAIGWHLEGSIGSKMVLARGIPASGESSPRMPELLAGHTSAERLPFEWEWTGEGG